MRLVNNMALLFIFPLTILAMFILFKAEGHALDKINKERNKKLNRY